MDRRQFLYGSACAVFLPNVAWSEPIKLRELYNKNKSFSDTALRLEGSKIEVRGYMAPPLKAETNFFVLTRRPMATCPFCESEAEWPSDIVAVYAKRKITPLPFNVPIIATGKLELGTYKDPELGFVSRLRLTDAKFERA
ncbi:hypothetical protein [Primorskyibacter sedentarius]|uniref:Uncharacterized protein n=1 Tax=Primorskyibacter sedentarius TaxID=745311 RepID=A0A4R3JN95_9RHOB|nr:hypothetical protein [Primorskyibacter sedentarius]TCS67124.1 hypothetical protein EDD52_101215 [Primorskyibacter sedentarius]